MSLAIGIDLGTTNSVVARLVSRRPALVADASGDPLLPSVAGFGADGGLLVGRSARNQLLVAPERTVRSVKRAMGSDRMFAMGGRAWTAPEVSALILRALVDRVEAATGERPEAAVITVPAWFTEPQRQATREAGRLAGLEVLRLVNEPTAAALTYEGDDEERLLVYDLGGGTFDVSVVERGPDFTEVLASRGDTHLGGDDVDIALARDLARRWGHPEVERDPVGWARLTAAAERAKIALSDRTTIRVRESYLLGEHHLDLTLTREELEEIALPMLAPTVELVREALKDARLGDAGVSRIVLVGGLTRMPMVHRLLVDAFGLPLHHEVDPDAAVALGAAILAARLSGEAVDAMLVDVTPQSLCVEAIHGRELVACTIIERNTVVPVTRAKPLYTASEDQPRVHLRIGQGEARLFADVTPLGEVWLDGLSPARSGSPIDVRMHLDASGVLEVTAVERNTGKEVRVTIADAPHALAERRRAGSTRAVDQAFARPSEGLEEAREVARGLLRQAASVATGEPEALARVKAAAAAIEAGIAGEDRVGLDRLCDALADALLDLI